MTVTIKGFQGTISDVDMATQFPHHMPAVFTANDLAVTAVGGARTVSVSAGSAISAFVRYTSDAAQTLALAPPTAGGKWYAITLNRQWSPTNTCVLQADDLAVTDGTGTIPAVAVPVAVLTAANALPDQLGTAGSTAGQRQILALVYVRAADTTLGIFDARMVATKSGNLRGMTPHALAVAKPKLLEGAIVTLGQWTAPSGQIHAGSTWRYNAGSGLLTLFGRIFGSGTITLAGIMTDIAAVMTQYNSALGIEGGPNVTGARMNESSTGFDYAWDASGGFVCADATSGAGPDYTGTTSANQGAYQRMVRRGYAISVQFYINLGANGSGAGNYIGRIPLPFRPGVSTAVVGALWQGNNWVGFVAMEITSDGLINIKYPSTSMPANSCVFFSASYSG